jgi:hypothetical protein
MNYDFSKWGRKELVDLLEFSGYSSDDIIDVTYKSEREGRVKFEISYEDIEFTEIRFGYVYVFIYNGKLVADY